MFRRSSSAAATSRAGHRQPGPQGRCSSSTDATNAGELTAAGWPRQVTIHRIGPKSFAVKKFQGQGGLAGIAALSVLASLIYGGDAGARPERALSNTQEGNDSN